MRPIISALWRASGFLGWLICVACAPSSPRATQPTSSPRAGLDVPQGVSVVVVEERGRIQLHAAVTSAAALGLPDTRIPASPAATRPTLRPNRLATAPSGPSPAQDALWCAEVQTPAGVRVARTCARPRGDVHLARDDRVGGAPAHADARQTTLRLKLPWVAQGQLRVTAMGQRLVWVAP